MEEKKAKGMLFGFSSARAEDMISKLPDSLISQILFYLPTKEAVRTSVLSNRWKSLWLLVPRLDLNSKEFSDYNAFVSFIDRRLDFSREENLCLHKLKLSVHKAKKDNQSCVTRCIDFVATARKLEHLDVECSVTDWEMMLDVMPVSLFICETLVCLRLRQVLFGSLAEFSVSLPLLKTMRLEFNVYANERSLESLISSCSVLEDLSVVRSQDDNVKVLRVRSQTLISLSIGYYDGTGENDNEEGVFIILPVDFDCEELGVLIDAPRLEYLNFEDEISPIKTITNPASLTKVDILGDFCLKNSDDQFRNFFTSFSAGVKDLKISYPLSVLIDDIVPFLPFGNLSSLEAELGFHHLEMLRRLLASCPNLKSLILDFANSSEGEQRRLSCVPLCLLSSLEFVEIECNFWRYPIVELVRYFAENSVILKKLVLRLRYSTLEENSAVLRNLLALPRRSSTCQIIVC